jgi:hypothetical protein
MLYGGYLKDFSCMKKIIVLLLLVISIYGCKSNSAFVHKTENVQECLNLLLQKQKKNYESLEHCRLILIKDSNTADLGDLYYSKNKVIIKDVAPSEIKVYAFEKDNTGTRYLKLSYIIVDDHTVNFEINLPNVNHFIKFILTKIGAIWKARMVQILVA